MPERSWEIELSKDSLKYLEKMEKRGAQRIAERPDELGKRVNPSFSKDVRPLTGKLQEFYRLWIGGVRVIFELDRRDKRVGILAIVPRGNAD